MYGQVVCLRAFAVFVGVSKSTVYNLLKLPAGHQYAEMPRGKIISVQKQAAIWEFQVSDKSVLSDTIAALSSDSIAIVSQLFRYSIIENIKAS